MKRLMLGVVLVVLAGALQGCAWLDQLRDRRPDIVLASFEPARPFPGPAGPAPFQATFEVVAGPAGPTPSPWQTCVDYADGTGDCTDVGENHAVFTHLYQDPGDYLAEAWACYTNHPEWGPKCTARAQALIVVTGDGPATPCPRCMDDNRLVGARLLAPDQVQLDVVRGAWAQVVVTVDVLQDLDLLDVTISDGNSVCALQTRPPLPKGYPAGAVEPFVATFRALTAGTCHIMVTVKASAATFGLEPLVLEKDIVVLPPQ